jgi:hypothetical protein
MERLDQIKKRLDNAKADSLVFGQLQLDMEWLISEVKKRENYWVDKHLNSLGENIKLHEDIEIKNRQLETLKKASRDYQKAFEDTDKELQTYKELVTKTNMQNLHLNKEIKQLEKVNEQLRIDVGFWKNTLAQTRAEHQKILRENSQTEK